jgi:hypothetical protein
VGCVGAFVLVVVYEGKNRRIRGRVCAYACGSVHKRTGGCTDRQTDFMDG